MITTANPLRRFHSRKDEILSAINRVLESGEYILGREVKSFEKEFAEWLGISYAVGVGNATDALEISLRALGIEKGDEVITVSHTATATIAAIIAAGAIPVMIDIDEETFTMNPELIEEAITERTRAVIPAHLYGHPADMNAICRIAREKNLKIIEDASQAHGAKINERLAGTIGEIGVFSFYPTKNIASFGDAGMLVTDNPELAKRIEEIRQYGWSSSRISMSFGRNSRMDELHAAILRVMLSHFEEDNSHRQAIAKFYLDALKSLPLKLPKVNAEIQHAWHLYHLHPAFKQFMRAQLSVTEKIANEILSLPIDSSMQDSEAEKVAELISRFF